MKDFVAIDFETANQYRSSVCSVGVVVVKGGAIVNEYYQLIQPIPNFYQPFTTNIHGLTQEDTDEAPLFPEVWAEVEPLLEGLPLVAHNCSFDEGCLKAVFDAYQMTYPQYRFYCTYRTAKQRIKEQLPNYQLQTVAHYCGYKLKNHHHALADAEACAKIALKLL